MSNSSLNINRPYLIIPKLIEQPTWGGSYIVENKGWANRPGHDLKIGQAYELFSGSNLSLLSSSLDPLFIGEITNNDDVQRQTNPDNSISIADLVATNPDEVIGESVVKKRGPKIALLIKFTQALGNSFQVHIKDGVKHPKWKPKPESWYYFEPGLLTFGVRHDASWEKYELAVRSTHTSMLKLSDKIKDKTITIKNAKIEKDKILAKYNPWQYVNTVAVSKGQVVDLSKGGIHHSWEEDSDKAPLGNVLIELQGEAMDDVSTFRSFDKGKIAEDGAIRDLHIDTYFDVIDRNPEANDPTKHIQSGSVISESTSHVLEQLMRSRHYDLDRLTINGGDSSYAAKIDRYKHIFIKDGKVRINAGDGELTVTTGHSCFIPGSTGGYKITNLTAKSEILISY